MLCLFSMRSLSISKKSSEMKSLFCKINPTAIRGVHSKGIVNLECKIMQYKCPILRQEIDSAFRFRGFKFSSAVSNYVSYRKLDYCILREMLFKKTASCAENISCRTLSSMKLANAKKKVSQKMEKIQENILTIPNGLCVLRMLATPVLGYLVLQGFYATSLGIFICAGITDVVDGYIARNFPKQQTMIGSFLDPAADKLLIATSFITLTFNGLIPVPLTLLIIFRDTCLMSAGFYIRFVSLPPPKTLVRYFDASFVTAKLSPTGISKANTLVQLSLVAFSLAAPVFGFVDHLYLQILWYITASTTMLSAGSYLYYKNTYKIIASHMERRKKL